MTMLHRPPQCFFWLILLSLTFHCVSSWIMPSSRSPSSRTRLLQSVEPTTTTTDVASSLSSVSSLPNLPKLIIFDLDNTLWTPELYQIRQKKVPRVHEEIKLFPDALPILQHLKTCDIQLAVASRTSKMNWAHQLLDDFDIDGIPLRQVFDYIEIQTGSKKQHLANLRQATGYTYSEMLFIDDDERMNLGEVSQLGVLCCHTPRGITMEHFCKSMQRYNQLMTGQQVGHWMGYVLNADNLGIEEEQVPAGKLLQGRIKFYSVQKRFGFVIDQDSREEFFFHESKVPAGMMVQTGDIVTFESSIDGKGRPSAIILEDNKNSFTQKPSDTVSLPCFSMSQPFASLLVNGIKTVESRNNPMFMDLKSGTKILLHCGRRDWHDQESYRAIMADAGYSEDEINRVSRLPRGFAKGNIVGILTIGKTWKSSEAERQGEDLQRKVLAPYEGIGKFCTEVTDAQWLNKPLKARGNAGVYSVDIPKDYLPES